MPRCPTLFINMAKTAYSNSKLLQAQYSGSLAGGFQQHVFPCMAIYVCYTDFSTLKTCAIKKEENLHTVLIECYLLSYHGFLHIDSRYHVEIYASVRLYARLSPTDHGQLRQPNGNRPTRPLREPSLLDAISRKQCNLFDPQRRPSFWDDY